MRTFQVTSQPLLSAHGGDYNNDGIINLAFATNGGVVGLMLGNGDGTFAAARANANLLSNAYLLLPFDLDYDGNLDLATIEANAVPIDALVVRMGNGDGSFAAARSYAPAYPTFVRGAFADFNEDDFRDFIESRVSLADISEVFISRGLGDGTFAPKVTVSFGANYLRAESADINNDGILDLIASKPDNTGFMIRLGQGDLSFKATTTFSTATTGPFHTLDVDLDGSCDLLINSAGNLQIARGNGDGTFAAVQATGLSNVLSWPFQIGSNADGVVDIAFTSTSNEIVVAYGNTTTSATGTSLQRFGHNYLGSPDITPRSAHGTGSASTDNLSGNADGRRNFNRCLYRCKREPRAVSACYPDWNKLGL